MRDSPDQFLDFSDVFESPTIFGLKVLKVIKISVYSIWIEFWWQSYNPVANHLQTSQHIQRLTTWSPAPPHAIGCHHAHRAKSQCTSDRSHRRTWKTLEMICWMAAREFTEGWIRVSKGFEGGVYKSFLAKKVREMVNLHKSWVALGLNSSTADTSNRFS